MSYEFFTEVHRLSYDMGIDHVRAGELDFPSQAVENVMNKRSAHSIFGGMNMGRFTKIAIAVACALGVTAISAQTVLRDGKEVKPAQTRAPVKVAQAAGGAAAGGAAGGSAAAGVSGGVIAAVAVGVAVVAVAASDSDETVTHSP